MKDVLLTNLNGIYVISLRELKKFFRQKTRFVGTLVRPFLWLIILGLGLNSIIATRGISYQNFIFPGIIGMTLLFTSIFSSVSIIWDREFGFLKEILVSPVSRLAIALGKALAGSFQALLQGSILLVFAPLLGIQLSVGIILQALVVMFLVSLGLTSMGIILATFMESFEGFNMVMNFLVMPMFFLSGAMFPVSNLPQWLKWLVRLNPLTYGVDALKNLFFPHIVNSPMKAEFALGYDLFLVILFMGAMLMIAMLAFRKRS